ncbi:hypothetical protein E4413_15665 [Leptospira interrogans]|uniref:Uncharacterized protein n=1 Tax=Leptospira interrogans serovar Bataviae TaxID=312175 RepID=A0AAP9WGW9_LEPIR|nr:hypothetical protein F3G11_02410 [Leptospira interrogans serovar Copenhageni]QCO34342.1 hypothetical protein E4414_15645 [Leptospira interrogans]QEH98870.1 hypothetical protein FWJ33_05085 [Leptospira interrogans serovar Hardjo]QOI33326.1 hypothetical protein LeptoLang_03180 [Leptospira interrogans serovar Icterohaemorrhagiae]QOI49574.1 hypothetical protein Lepto1489_03215 [Leptospira interrogans serovar Bataviae]
MSRLKNSAPRVLNSIKCFLNVILGEVFAEFPDRVLGTRRTQQTVVAFRILDKLYITKYPIFFFGIGFCEKI